MSNELVKVEDNVLFVLRDEFGNIKQELSCHNLMTTLGKNALAEYPEASPTFAKPGWMEVGTGSAGGAGSSILTSYISGSRTALDSKIAAGAVLTMICTFPAGVGTGAITEAGIFNVVTQNTTDLLSYSTFSVINKAAGDSLQITWTWTVS